MLLFFESQNELLVFFSSAQEYELLLIRTGIRAASQIRACDLCLSYHLPELLAGASGHRRVAPGG